MYDEIEKRRGGDNLESERLETFGGFHNDVCSDYLPKRRYPSTRLYGVKIQMTVKKLYIFCKWFCTWIATTCNWQVMQQYIVGTSLRLVEISLPPWNSVWADPQWQSYPPTTPLYNTLSLFYKPHTHLLVTQTDVQHITRAMYSFSMVSWKAK
jgi:hypothetical protein